MQQYLERHFANLLNIFECLSFLIESTLSYFSIWILSGHGWMNGWIKEGGVTSDRSRTLARGQLFGPNVLP
jgi:hypothetical protein